MLAESLELNEIQFTVLEQNRRLPLLMPVERWWFDELSHWAGAVTKSFRTDSFHG
jgi:hypothetical protein